MKKVYEFDLGLCGFAFYRFSVRFGSAILPFTGFRSGPGLPLPVSGRADPFFTGPDRFPVRSFLNNSTGEVG